MTQKLSLVVLPILFTIFTALPLSATVLTATASAATVTCYDGSKAAKTQDCTHACPNGQRVPQDTDCAVSGGNCSTSLQSCDLIVKFVKPFIQFLTALVGVAVVFSLIVGGIQYSSSAGDPSKVTAAKNRMRNAIIALLVYFFFFALLNFLVPGGIMNSSFLF